MTIKSIGRTRTRMYISQEISYIFSSAQKLRDEMASSPIYYQITFWVARFFRIVISDPLRPPLNYNGVDLILLRYMTAMQILTLLQL